MRELIESPWPEGHSKPPTFVLRSKDHATPAEYSLENGEWNIKNPVMQNGDGRILFESALPPYDIDADHLTPNGHGALLNDINQIDKILTSLAATLPPNHRTKEHRKCHRLIPPLHQSVMQLFRALPSIGQ